MVLTMADKPRPAAAGPVRRRPRSNVSADVAGWGSGTGLASRLKRTRLDLLPVLHELLRTRSVTRTARSLGITQPAVSQSLRRLRRSFGDDLLVSLGRELQLTDRAEALSEPLHGILVQVASLLSPSRPFDPALDD